MTGLKAGDVVLVHSERSWVHALIRFFSRSHKEEPTHFNHVGMMINDWQVAEALMKGLKYRNVHEVYGPDSDTQVLVVRHLDLTQKNRLELIALVGRDMLTYAGYGWWKHAGHFLDWGLSRAASFVTRQEYDLYLTRRLFRTGRHGVCSYKVGAWFKEIGLSFRKPINQLQPDDIADEICWWVTRYHKTKMAWMHRWIVAAHTLKGRVAKAVLP